MSNSKKLDNHERNPFRPINCEFESLLLNEKFSDFVLFFPNAEESRFSRIPVHRFLLDARSTFFHKFFAESPTAKSMTVCFPQWCLSNILEILRYFYTSKPITITSKNAAAISFIACRWGCEELLQFSNNFIITELKPEDSLDALYKLSSTPDHDTQLIDHLVNMVAKNIVIFSPNCLAQLAVDIFERIAQIVYSSRPNDASATALCNCIEKYVDENIFKLGKTMFELLAQQFTMKTNSNGIITLMKYAIKFNWGTAICKAKILHSWCYLDQNMLAKLPISELKDMLKENYINTRSEDEIFSFILLVSKEQEGEDVSSLWQTLRVPWLSDECKKKLREDTSSLIPQQVKDHINCPKNVFQTRRIPRGGTKCLVLGAADNASLDDVVNFLSFSCFNKNNLVALRADKEIPKEIDFSDFNAILVFGFYKFHDANRLSQRLAAFLADGGGLVIAFGAHRPDAFGLGDPILSMLPIDTFHQDIVYKMTAVESIEEKEQSIGCKHMRMLFNAKHCAEVLSRWDDGVPFIIRQNRTEKRGGIVVFNATPVSSDIIPEQWTRHDKSMAKVLTDAIVSVANLCYSKQSK